MTTATNQKRKFKFRKHVWNFKVGFCAHQKTYWSNILKNQERLSLAFLVVHLCVPPRVPNLTGFSHCNLTSELNNELASLNFTDATAKTKPKVHQKSKMKTTNLSAKLHIWSVTKMHWWHTLPNSLSQRMSSKTCENATKWMWHAFWLVQHECWTFWQSTHLISLQTSTVQQEIQCVRTLTIQILHLLNPKLQTQTYLASTSQKMLTFDESPCELHAEKLLAILDPASLLTPAINFPVFKDTIQNSTGLKLTKLPLLMRQKSGQLQFWFLMLKTFVASFVQKCQPSPWHWHVQNWLQKCESIGIAPIWSEQTCHSILTESEQCQSVTEIWGLSKTLHGCNVKGMSNCKDSCRVTTPRSMGGSCGVLWCFEHWPPHHFWLCCLAVLCQ